MPRISSFESLTSPANGDLVPIVDVSDTSMAATGTTKQVTFENMMAAISAVLTADNSSLTTAITALTATVATNATAALQKSNNLSDVGSTTTARTNLGLGSAAQSATSAFLAAGTTLDAIPAPVASVSFNSEKGTNAAPGTLATDLATIGQLKLDFNVKSVTYGAKGDGTTVDTTAIQNTVAAAITAGGGDILFPPGTFVMSNVTWGSNLNIVGSGQGNTIFLLDPAANGTVSTVVVCRVAPASSVTDTSYCYMHDLTIDGNKSNWGANTTNRFMGYYLGQSTAGLISHCGIKNVEFRNCMSYACDIERATYSTIDNCEAHDNGYSSGSGSHINADGFTMIGDDIQLVNCRAWNNAVEGFRGGQSGAAWYRVQIVNCHAFTNGGNGASIGADTTGGDVLWDSQIIGGSYYSNTGAGVLLNPNANNCGVHGTTVWGNTTNGILVDGALNCSITGNNLRDNATAGATNPELYLSAGSQYITVVGNTIRSANATHAISEQSAASVDYNIIDGNTVASTGTTVATVGTHTVIGTNQGYTVASGSTTESPLPGDSEFLWWTGDPEYGATTTLGALPTAGSLYMHQFVLTSAQTLTGVVHYMATAGSVLTTNECYIGIYDSTGTLRATTGDMSGETYTVSTTASSAAVSGTGFVAGMVGNQYTIAGVAGTFTVATYNSSTSITMSTTVPTMVTSQTMTPTTNYSWLGSASVKVTNFVSTYAAPAGRYYVAYMFNGTTGPIFKGSGTIVSIVNLNQTAANYRIALSSSTGNTTALPGTITLSGNVGNSSAIGVWTAGF